MNIRRIKLFRATLSEYELKEIHLHNKRFMWSNDRDNPIMSKLDTFFGNAEWDLHFNTHIIHPMFYHYRSTIHLCFQMTGGQSGWEVLDLDFLD
jgi:hypothetical protein